MVSVWCPTTSMTRSAILPSVISATAATRSSLAALTVCVARIFFDTDSLKSTRSEVITVRAPRLLMVCEKRSPIGPCPIMTVSRLSKFGSFRQAQTTVPRGCDIRMQSFRGKSVNGTVTLSSDRKYSESPPIWRGSASTSSPTLNLSDLLSVTTPIASWIESPG